MRAERPAAIPRGIRPRERPARKALLLSEELIDQFLLEKQRNGCTRDTLGSYRQYLLQLYEELPERKEIRPGTLADWQARLVEKGYATRTVNKRLSAANSLVDFCDRRELQVPDLPLPTDDVQPELTRREYLRLLSAARALGKEQAYLLVKVFACTGLSLQALPCLTAEAVRQGRLVMTANGVRQIIQLPAALRDDLTGYIQRNGLSGGPVFVSRNGKVLGRL